MRDRSYCVCVEHLWSLDRPSCLGERLANRSSPPLRCAFSLLSSRSRLTCSSEQILDTLGEAIAKHSPNKTLLRSLLPPCVPSSIHLSLSLTSHSSLLASLISDGTGSSLFHFPTSSTDCSTRSLPHQRRPRARIPPHLGIQAREGLLECRGLHGGGLWGRHEGAEGVVRQPLGIGVLPGAFFRVREEGREADPACRARGRCSIRFRARTSRGAFFSFFPRLVY